MGRAAFRAPRSRRILLFARLPAPGRVKTRLTPLLGPRGAAELYAAFLEDTAAAVRAVEGAEPELWLEPPADRSGSRIPTAHRAAARLADRVGMRLRWQEGEGLGTRLRRAFEAAFADGVTAAVAVGSDHPTLPEARLSEAFRALEKAEVTIGPSRDGGYYLVGLRSAAWPSASILFRDMPWSTPRLLPRTRAAVERVGLTARELAEWYDIDEPEDLERLRGDVRSDSRTAAALDRLLPTGGERGPRPGARSAPPRP